ncbi:Pectinesterase inhibitor 9 [Sesamum angolense]|uniref:Pectinesterase inhibitor 9 n=1 Tax=Sesamum angolense TaxID=2727404 RepID=A0AAE1T5I7_9LAMI|nr:Pectinesterase inhibitor 9 [Sesamum angolense]
MPSHSLPGFMRPVSLHLLQHNPAESEAAGSSCPLSQLIRAQSVASFVSTMARMRGLRPIEYRTVKDCIDNMANTVDQLNQSVQELSRADQDFDWHVGNVESWVGAALTFENTCLDGFRNPTMDGNVKVAITTRVTDCAQVTSNALVLVDRFASRHKAGASSSEGTANLP